MFQQNLLKISRTTTTSNSATIFGSMTVRGVASWLHSVGHGQIMEDKGEMDWEWGTDLTVNEVSMIGYYWLCLDICPATDVKSLINYWYHQKKISKRKLEDWETTRPKEGSGTSMWSHKTEVIWLIADPERIYNNNKKKASKHSKSRSRDFHMFCLAWKSPKVPNLTNIAERSRSLMWIGWSDVGQTASRLWQHPPVTQSNHTLNYG